MYEISLVIAIVKEKVQLGDLNPANEALLRALFVAHFMRIDSTESVDRAVEICEEFLRLSGISVAILNALSRAGYMVV